MLGPPLDITLCVRFKLLVFTALAAPAALPAGLPATAGLAAPFALVSVDRTGSRADQDATKSRRHIPSAAPQLEAAR
jgi:hypothetical protein